MKTVVKDSSIPGAGKGLFAARDIKRGERIIPVRGPMLTDQQCEELAEENKDSYLLAVRRGKTMNVSNEAMYANDANGLVKVGRNNASFHVASRSVGMYASRNIKAGEEIFVGYGKGYWDAIKSRQKETVGV